MTASRMIKSPVRNPAAIPFFSIYDRLDQLLSKFNTLFPLWAILAAANQWSVPVEQLNAKDGKVMNSAGDVLSYGELAEAAGRVADFLQHRGNRLFLGP